MWIIYHVIKEIKKLSIIMRGLARVPLPPEYRSEVLSMYTHYANDGTFLRTYRYKDGYAYLPLNQEKLRKVAKLLGEDIIDQRSEGEPIMTPYVQNPTFKFREHQVIPSAKLLLHCQENNYGVLKAPCGCGKSATVTWVAGMLGHKILVLVDQGNLLSQWVNTFKMVWGRELQVLNKDSKEFGDCVITTFQLLHSNPELVMNIRERFGVLAMDEWQSTTSQTRKDILDKISTKYCIGTTATPYKKGFSDEILTDYVSGISVEMVDKNAMVPEVHFVETNRAWYSSNPDDWGRIQSKLGKDEERNKHIAKLTMAMVTAGRKVLVIGITVDSLRYINSILTKDPFCKSIVYTGSTTLIQDEQLRADIEEGTINCCLSVKKFDKGTDCPSLDCLILAKPANNEAFITQICGRIVRPVEGKLTPLVFDFVDNNSLATRFAGNRKKWYKKLGYTVEEN